MTNRRRVAVAVGAAVILTSSAIVFVLAERAMNPGRVVAAKTAPTPTHEATASPSASKTTATPMTTATPTPAATPTPRPSVTAIIPTSTPRPPAYVGYFGTLPPGSALPSDAQCASEIAPNAWEPRPENSTANHTNVYAQGNRFQSSYFAYWAPSYTRRVTGNYVGTTDQIIRWAACKWGFDENTVRAQAVIESYWKQSTLGDCNGGTTQPATHGCESVGLLQVRGANIPPTHPGTWPAAWSSTSFNADYAMAIRRMCFEGKETWLGNGYASGDLWGCIGRWYSGGWHDAGANPYIQKVQATDAAKTWTTF